MIDYTSETNISLWFFTQSLPILELRAHLQQQFLLWVT